MQIGDCVPLQLPQLGFVGLNHPAMKPRAMTSPRLLRPHSLRLRSIIAEIFGSLRWTVNALALLPIRAIRSVYCSAKDANSMAKRNPRRRQGT